MAYNNATRMARQTALASMSTAIPATVTHTHTHTHAHTHTPRPTSVSVVQGQRELSGRAEVASLQRAHVALGGLGHLPQLLIGLSQYTPKVYKH
jgi:hypothetical protein